MILVHGIPLYWGVETDPYDRSFITRATLDEVLPPYRESRRAIRVRVSHRHWLHIGICQYKTEVTPWGIEVSPERIGRWGLSDPEEEDDYDYFAPEIRSDEGRGTPHADGVFDGEAGGTDAWTGSSGD